MRYLVFAVGVFLVAAAFAQDSPRPLVPWNPQAAQDLLWPEDLELYGRELALPRATASRPTLWLGVGHKAGEAGLVIEQVVKDSPAGKAGILQGDELVALGGAPMKSGDDLGRAIQAGQAGQSVTVSLRRGNEVLELQVVLEARPSVRLEAREHPGWPSASVESPSALAQRLSADDGKAGLEAAQFLEDVSNMSWGEEALTGTAIPLRPREFVYAMRNPAATALVAQHWAARSRAGATADHLDVAKLLSAAADAVDRGPAERPGLPGSAEVVFETLRGAQESLREFAASRSEGAETRLLHAFGSDENVEAAALIADLAAVDRGALAAIAVRLGAVFAPAPLAALRAWAIEKGPGRHLTPAGPMRVGGEGDDRHEPGDEFLILDLGGDDDYLHPAAAGPGELRIVLDLGGSDSYRAPGAGGPSLGGGLYGVGMLLDLGQGDDLYRSDRPAMGCGLAGAGLLVDAGGDDRYLGRSLIQGVGLAGFGVLADLGGNDLYQGDIWGQALGLPGGAGFLLDCAGNDLYLLGGKVPDFRDEAISTQSMGQGFGFGMRPWEGRPGCSGGMGLLFDHEGEDVYQGDYFCQGSSYWYAAGFLVDAEGRDSYLCGRYSQGAGIHLSVGALVDGSGDDAYQAYKGVSQGCGHDWAVGVLWDRGGNDRYDGDWLIQGAGNDNGVGLLIDAAGDDLYRSRSESAQGWANRFEARGNKGALGLLLDLAGDDRFTQPVGEDGSTLRPAVGLLWDRK